MIDNLASDPYVLILLAGAALTSLAWLFRELVLPGAKEALRRFVLANLGDIVSKPIAASKADTDARIDALRHELNERQTTDEQRYDGELNDLRDALKTVVYMPAKREEERP